MKISSIRIFSTPVRAAASVLRQASQAIPSPFGALLNAVTQQTSSTIGIDPEYQALLQQQMHFQAQMQAVSMESNASRTEHETRMAVVRNVRVA